MFAGVIGQEFHFGTPAISQDSITETGINTPINKPRRSERCHHDSPGKDQS